MTSSRGCRFQQGLGIGADGVGEVRWVNDLTLYAKSKYQHFCQLRRVHHDVEGHNLVGGCQREY